MGVTRRTAATLVAATAVLAGCTGTGQGPGADATSATDAAPQGSEQPGRPSPSASGAASAVPATPAPIEVVGEHRPTVSWPAVDGAATYRLTVLQDEGRTWAWEGATTEVVLGGGEQDGDGHGFRLRSDAVVSVSAHGPDGEVLRFDQVRVAAPRD